MRPFALNTSELRHKKSRIVGFLYVFPSVPIAILAAVDFGDGGWR
jgi:hypothetical protein